MWFGPDAGEHLGGGAEPGHGYTVDAGDGLWRALLVEQEPGDGGLWLTLEVEGRYPDSLAG